MSNQQDCPDGFGNSCSQSQPLQEKTPSAEDSHSPQNGEDRRSRLRSQSHSRSRSFRRRRSCSRTRLPAHGDDVEDIIDEASTEEKVLELSDGRSKEANGDEAIHSFSKAEAKCIKCDEFLCLELNTARNPNSHQKKRKYSLDYEREKRYEKNECYSSKQQTNLKKLYIPILPHDITISGFAHFFPKAFKIALNDSSPHKSACVNYTTEENAAADLEACKDAIFNGESLGVVYAVSQEKKMDVLQRVEILKEENLKEKLENQLHGQYNENLMSASSVLCTSPNIKKYVNIPKDIEKVPQTHTIAKKEWITSKIQEGCKRFMEYERSAAHLQALATQEENLNTNSVLFNQILKLSKFDFTRGLALSENEINIVLKTLKKNINIFSRNEEYTNFLKEYGSMYVGDFFVVGADIYDASNGRKLDYVIETQQGFDHMCEIRGITHEKVKQLWLIAEHHTDFYYMDSSEKGSIYFMGLRSDPIYFAKNFSAFLDKIYEICDRSYPMNQPNM